MDAAQHAAGKTVSDQSLETLSDWSPLVLTVAPNGRSAMRSSSVTTHNPGTPVVTGQQFSLARTFPH